MLYFPSVGDTLIVVLSLPFAAIGGVWFISALGNNWSVTGAMGFIALTGVATCTTRSSTAPSSDPRPLARLAERIFLAAP